jgi:hypothetical protein
MALKTKTGGGDGAMPKLHAFHIEDGLQNELNIDDKDWNQVVHNGRAGAEHEHQLTAMEALKKYPKVREHAPLNCPLILRSPSHLIIWYTMYPFPFRKYANLHP